MSNNDNTQQTPDLMLEALERAGYSLIFQRDKNHARLYGYWYLCTPDGWELSSPNAFKDTNRSTLHKHAIIQQAYVHLQATQETARLRARVAELEKMYAMSQEALQNFKDNLGY